MWCSWFYSLLYCHNRNSAFWFQVGFLFFIQNLVFSVLNFVVLNFKWMALRVYARDHSFHSFRSALCSQHIKLTQFAIRSNAFFICIYAYLVNFIIFKLFQLKHFFFVIFLQYRFRSLFVVCFFCSFSLFSIFDNDEFCRYYRPNILKNDSGISFGSFIRSAAFFLFIVFF